MDLLNLKGTPVKKLRLRSSDAVIARSGRLGLMQHALICLECPDISPTEEPVSARKEWPNLQLS
jgi:hypothetical protein